MNNLFRDMFIASKIFKTHSVNVKALENEIL